MTRGNKLESKRDVVVTQGTSIRKLVLREWLFVVVNPCRQIGVRVCFYVAIQQLYISTQTSFIRKREAAHVLI